MEALISTNGLMAPSRMNIVYKPYLEYEINMEKENNHLIMKKTRVMCQYDTAVLASFMTGIYSATQDYFIYQYIKMLPATGGYVLIQVN